MNGEVGAVQKDEIKVMTEGVTIKLEMELDGQELEQVKEFVCLGSTPQNQILDSKSNKSIIETEAETSS